MNDLNGWTVLTLVLWVFVVLLGLLVWGVLRQLGVLHKRIDALQTKPAASAKLSDGVTAPAFTLPEANGGTLSSYALLGKAALIAFVHPDCGPCKKMLPHLNSASRRLNPALGRIVLVSLADAEASASLREGAGDLALLFDAEGDVADTYYAEFTPYLVAIDRHGRVRGTRAGGAVEKVEALLTAGIGHAGWALGGERNSHVPATPEGATAVLHQV